MFYQSEEDKKDMPNEFPTTIITRIPDFFHNDYSNRILLQNNQFIELVKIEELKTVFRCGKKDYEAFFAVKEGFCFYTSCYDIKTYEELLNEHKVAEEKGFTKFSDYIKAKKIGAENNDVFSEFCRSKFYDKNEYENEYEIDIYDFTGEFNEQSYAWKIKKYFEKNSQPFREFEHAKKIREEKKKIEEEAKKEAKKRGFSNVEQYRLASTLGNLSSDEFNEFRDSRFYQGDFSSEKNKNGYQEFKEEKKAINLGFDSLENYRDALRLEFKDAKIYFEFLQSKCETREEFEFFKNLPRLLEIKIKKIDEVVNDAEKAYKSNRFEEFIRLKFLSLELITDALYFKTFRKGVEPNDDLKVDDIINKIESQINKSLVDHEELKYWRRIRNKIVHDHAKIEKDRVEKGKEFFEEFFKNLNKYLSE